MTCSEMECLTYKYSLIAVILVPIICTLSMSLLVPLASVPTTINNSVRFSVELLSTFVLLLLFLIIIIIFFYYYYYPARAWQKLHNCEARVKTPKEHGRPSDQRNMDREHFVDFHFCILFFLISFHILKNSRFFDSRESISISLLSEPIEPVLGAWKGKR